MKTLWICMGLVLSVNAYAQDIELMSENLSEEQQEFWTDRNKASMDDFYILKESDDKESWYRVQPEFNEDSSLEKILLIQDSPGIGDLNTSNEAMDSTGPGCPTGLTICFVDGVRTCCPAL